MRGELAHLPLVGGAEVRVERRHLGEDHEAVAPETACEQRGGAILVDDRIDPGQPTAAADDGNAAAAARDHDRACGNKGTDGRQLDDVERLRGGYDAPVPPVGVLVHRPAALALKLLG